MSGLLYSCVVDVIVFGIFVVLYFGGVGFVLWWICVVVLFGKVYWIVCVVLFVGGVVVMGGNLLLVLNSGEMLFGFVFGVEVVLFGFVLVVGGCVWLMLCVCKC